MIKLIEFSAESLSAESHIVWQPLARSSQTLLAVHRDIKFPTHRKHH